MLCGRNYHELIPIGNQTFAEYVLGIYFFLSYTCFFGHLLQRSKCSSADIKHLSHTLHWHLSRQTNQLCFLPAAHQVILPHSPVTLGTSGRQQEGQSCSSSSQSILRGLHCKAKEVLKEDTNRLILQLVSNPRKLKTVCLNTAETDVLQAHPPQLSPQ